MIIIAVFRLLLLALGMAIAAWISVHILAFLGIFLAIGYLLWWMFFPNRRFCLICLFLRKKEKCGFCQKNKTAWALILGFVLIIIFAVLSIGVVFVENYALSRLGLISSPKTVSFAIPGKGQFRIGDLIPLEIEVSGIKAPINSVQADIGFDPNALSVVDISTKGSFANIFIQKEIDNEGGWARLTGGLANPGYFADHGTFGTVYFKTKQAGLTTVRFLSSSMVLANDGRGTNVLKDYPTFAYLVIPEKISPAEEQGQMKLLSETPTPVLGAEAGEGIPEGAQLKFFDDARPSVLGVGSQVAPEPKENPKLPFLEWIKNFDSWIISFWQKLL